MLICVGFDNMLDETNHPNDFYLDAFLYLLTSVHLFFDVGKKRRFIYVKLWYHFIKLLRFEVYILLELFVYLFWKRKKIECWKRYMLIQFGFIILHMCWPMFVLFTSPRLLSLCLAHFREMGNTKRIPSLQNILKFFNFFKFFNCVQFYCIA